MADTLALWPPAISVMVVLAEEALTDVGVVLHEILVVPLLELLVPLPISFSLVIHLSLHVLQCHRTPTLTVWGVIVLAPDGGV